MNFIVRLILPIIALVMALLGVFALLFLAVGFGALSLRGSFHWFLLFAIISTAAFGIYSFIYYLFGSDPRRQVQVIVSAFAFLALWILIQSPASRSFIH